MLPLQQSLLTRVEPLAAEQQLAEKIARDRDDVWARVEFAWKFPQFHTQSRQSITKVMMKPIATITRRIIVWPTRTAM